MLFLVIVMFNFFVNICQVIGWEGWVFVPVSTTITSITITIKAYVFCRKVCIIVVQSD